jgi:hypothetical protein
MQKQTLMMRRQDAYVRIFWTTKSKRLALPHAKVNRCRTPSTVHNVSDVLAHVHMCALSDITHDTHQMLFRACCDDTVRSDGQHCQRAVLPFDSPLLSDTSGECTLLHTHVSCRRQYRPELLSTAQIQSIGHHRMIMQF